MTIVRRLGTGYACIALACTVVVAWLAYHEFIEEPAEFAALGLINVHKDTEAEVTAVCLLAMMPVMLGLGWWWMRRILAPLQALTHSVERMDSHNLRQLLPRTGTGDEVDKLTAVFNSMTARLDDSFRRIQEFTLHASHELKTPLTVMRMQLETSLREGAGLPEGHIAGLEAQLDEVMRLTRIVDSLTLLTKADAGLVELEQKPVQLHDLVGEAFEDAQLLAQSREIKVSLNPCEAVVVAGDRHRLRQLLLILTDNAVKYNVQRGLIEMSLRRLEDTAELRITNTGGAIAPGAGEKLFDRFVRGEGARGSVDGCGLGLTIARWIVQAHGGTVQLLPEPPDRTTALVRLPVRSSAVPAADVPGATGGRPPG